MNVVNRFVYRTLDRITYPSGARHYLCPDTGRKLASVTTILDRTAPEKRELIEWKKRVGEAKAEQIKKEALGLGTLMHTHLENHINGIARPGGNNTVRIMAEKMADQIIEHGLSHIDEVWSSEAVLYSPGLYAGTCDGAGRFKGEEAIIDFKTAKKLRTRDMINDYLLQVVAYAICHNELYGTNINTGVIFMVDREYNFRQFVVEKDEFHTKTIEWFDRVEKFLEVSNENRR